MTTISTTPALPVLSDGDVKALLAQATRHAVGGGYTGLLVRSQWVANVRWARNRILSTGEDRNNHILVLRDIQGAQSPEIYINETTDAALAATVRETERLIGLIQEQGTADLITHVQLEPEPHPQLVSAATYEQTSEQRAAIAQRLMQSAIDAGMLSAGYVEVQMFSTALVTSFGLARYDQYTWARGSMTVRDPQGKGSGWAGIDWPDWNKIDGDKLVAVALDKCLKSRNALRVEPGRYTTILEPQAVSDLMSPMMSDIGTFSWFNYTEGGSGYLWNARPAGRGDPGASKLGEKVVDPRITISTDPTDPECGFPQWQQYGGQWANLMSKVFHPTTWIKNGVLTSLESARETAIFMKGQNEGSPTPAALHIEVSGPTTTTEEMIATTKRGLLVTRFDRVRLMADGLLFRGYTRDGLWLIENGKISQPAVNLAFTESVLYALNAIDQLGAPQRVFHPKRPGWRQIPPPAFVPAMKIRDFSFTALADSV